MPNVSLKRQVRTTLGVLVTLMVDPKLKADDLAKIAGLTPNGVARLLGELRDAGFDVHYDYSKEKYVGKLTADLEESILGPVAQKIRRAVSKSEASRPPVRLVSSLERYTVPQFAELTGDTPSNVYNKITGYKGAKLPAGWVAYQNTERGKWMVQKMVADRTGTKFTLPENVKEAAQYVIGEGDPQRMRARPLKCLVCDETNVVARGLCGAHYQDARRHPDKYKALLSKADR
jgi:hypothetical protein